VPIAANVAKKTLEEHTVQVMASMLVDKEVSPTFGVYHANTIRILTAHPGITWQVLIQIEQVAQLCLAEAQDVSSDMLKDEDYALVNANAADQIMNSIMFRHTLGLLSSKGVLWDFQNFAEEDFANTLFAEVSFRQQVITKTLTSTLMEGYAEAYPSNSGVVFRSALLGQCAG